MEYALATVTANCVLRVDKYTQHQVVIPIGYSYGMGERQSPAQNVWRSMGIPMFRTKGILPELNEIQETKLPKGYSRKYWD